MKKPRWLFPFMLITLLINLLIRNFDLRDFEVQLHDTYFVFDAPTAVFIMTLIIYAIVGSYLLVEMNTNKMLSLIIAIVNPIGAIFMLLLVYMSLQTLTTFRNMYPENDPTGHLVFVAVVIGLLCLQAVIEWKTLKQVRGLLGQGEKHPRFPE